MEMKPADVEMQSVEQDVQRVKVEKKPYQVEKLAGTSRIQGNGDEF